VVSEAVKELIIAVNVVPQRITAVSNAKWRAACEGSNGVQVVEQQLANGNNRLAEWGQDMAGGVEWKTAARGSN